MRQAVQEDLNESSKIFKRTVWPEIQSWFDNGQLIPVESVTASKMADKLDVYAGIDAWHFKKEKGIRGIASRVQWLGKAFNTFTVSISSFFK